MATLLLLFAVPVLWLSVLGVPGTREAQIHRETQLTSLTQQAAEAAGTTTALFLELLNRNVDDADNAAEPELLSETGGGSISLFPLAPMNFDQRMGKGDERRPGNTQERRKSDLTAHSQHRSSAPLPTLYLFPEHPMDLDQAGDLLSGNRETDARLRNSGERTSPLQPHSAAAGGASSRSPIRFSELSWGGDIGLQSGALSSTIVPEEETMMSSRGHRVADVIDMSSSSHGRSPPEPVDFCPENQTPSLAKRCRQRTAGNQFPLFGADHSSFSVAASTAPFSGSLD
jgi:hypothetical protein